MLILKRLAYFLQTLLNLCLLRTCLWLAAAPNAQASESVTRVFPSTMPPQQNLKYVTTRWYGKASERVLLVLELRLDT